MLWRAAALLAVICTAALAVSGTETYSVEENGNCSAHVGSISTLCPVGTGPMTYTTGRSNGKCVVECLPCAAGTYKDTESADECTDCPPDSTSLAGSTEEGDCERTTLPIPIPDLPDPALPDPVLPELPAIPTPAFCGPGYFTFGSKCRVCPPNTWSSSNSTESHCTACEGGKVTESFLAIAESCCGCMAGLYELAGGVCDNCPVGYYSSWGPGPCVRCPVGATTMCEGSSSFEDCGCGPGSKLIGDRDGEWSCELCGVDTYSTEMNSASCENCEEYKSTAGFIGQTNCGW